MIRIHPLSPMLFCAALAAAAPRPVDLDGDGRVDAGDAQAFLDAVAKGAPPKLDLDGDGKVGLSDALLYGRWIDGLWEKPAAGLGSLYFQDPADSAAFANYEADAKAKEGWGLPQVQAAYPGTSKAMAAIAGPMEFETEMGNAFARMSPGFDKAGFFARVRSNGVAFVPGSGYPNMFQALDQIHDVDLPLLFTTDALLHTVALSYDNLLAQLEEARFRGLLDGILRDASEYAETRYGKDASGKDVIELLGTARLLLNRNRTDMSASPAMTAHLADIDAQALKKIALWGRDTTIDFSQFKPRGHYTRDDNLRTYFQAMMWLSRADLAFDLRAGAAADKAAYTRMKRDAVILWDCLVGSGAYPAWLEIDRAIGYLVGQSDGLSPKGMGLVLNAMGTTDAAALVAAFPEARFDSAVAAGRFGAQAILSQHKDYLPGSALDLSPICSFMPQRFILDSYTFSQLVHPVTNLVAWPSPLQVSFALGDNASLADIPAAGAAANGRLAAQRALYDGISEGGWRSNLYTGWLGFLRKLNSEDVSHAAAVFQAPAWKLKMRNTQLASWAELRHNTLLYAKQSYTGGVLCDFPKAYVEPYPAFFGAVAAYAKDGGRVFKDQAEIADYFGKLASISERLQAIAARSAQGLGPAGADADWLRSALTYTSKPVGCSLVKTYDGWFLDLIYGSPRSGIDDQADAEVADVHTKPVSDELGPNGVLFVGTGSIRLAAVAVAGDSCVTVYAAPVLSYYEKKQLNSLTRMDDDEWRKSFASPGAPAQPAWMKPLLGP